MIRKSFVVVVVVGIECDRSYGGGRCVVWHDGSKTRTYDPCCLCTDLCNCDALPRTKTFSNQPHAAC